MGEPFLKKPIVFSLWILTNRKELFCFGTLKITAAEKKRGFLLRFWNLDILLLCGKMQSVHFVINFGD